jgi:hypothetical protein
LSNSPNGRHPICQYEGAVFTEGGYQFQITYHGGTGGDSVVLTRVV